MNKKQGNKLRMYKAVSAVLAEHAESVRSLRAFVPAVQRFNDVIMQICSQDQRILESSVGKTAAKDSVEASLKIILLRVSSALASHAYRSGDQELAAAVRFNKSDFDHKTQVNLWTIALALAGIAAGYQVQLAAYGIDAAQLTALDRLGVDYIKAVGRKEGGFAERSAAVQAIKELFRVNDRNLREDLDRIMELFRYEQADFYHAYRAARYIKNLGHRFRAKAVESPNESSSEFTTGEEDIDRLLSAPQVLIEPVKKSGYLFRNWIHSKGKSDIEGNYETDNISLFHHHHRGNFLTASGGGGG